MSLYRGSRRITRPIVHGNPARMLVFKGRQVWPCRGPLTLPPSLVRMTADANEEWFEVGFRSGESLTGTAATGWTDPRGYCTLALERSTDMAIWTPGGWTDCADSGTETEAGVWEYWGRYVIPRFWETTLVDLAAETDRWGKSITGISVYAAPVSLPHFPYAMPAAAATLAADLAAAGYPGATVTSTPAGITAHASNHFPKGRQKIILTQAGGVVTAATALGGAAIPLPQPTYTLPGAQASLQTDLRSAGYPGAVVTLHAGTWELRLPDRPATGAQRQFSLTISPGDPYPHWDYFENYLGLAPATGISGTSGNVRTPTGAPLAEAPTQFARLKIRPGPRTLP